MSDVEFGRRGEALEPRVADTPTETEPERPETGGAPPIEPPEADGVPRIEPPRADGAPEVEPREADGAQRERPARKRLAVLRATPTTSFSRPERSADTDAPPEGPPETDAIPPQRQATPFPLAPAPSPAATEPVPPPMTPTVPEPPAPAARAASPAPPAPPAAPAEKTAPQHRSAPPPTYDEGAVRTPPGDTDAKVSDQGSAGGGPLGRLRAAVPTRRPTWKSVALVLVGIAIVFWATRGLVGQPAQQAGSAQGGENKVAVPKAKKPPANHFVVNGRAVRPAGALITLNPALAQAGSQVALAGQGFDARSTVDVVLSSKGSQNGTSLGSFKTDRIGNMSASITIPDNIRGGAVVITARERGSNNVATAEAVSQAGIGFAKLSKASGRPGDTVSVSARGFSPGEKIGVYWGRVSGTPTTTVQADGGGSISQASVKVGFQAPGSATMVLVGAKSGTTATVPFYMQALYPTAATQPYSLKAGETINLSASGFAPGERVQTFVNASSGPPALVATADGQGNIGGVGFKVPFGLQGPQSLVLVGELSRATVTSGFDVLPYTPSAQPSTYGGSPGTAFSFFVKDFAPHEVVLVYLGRSATSRGELVNAFRVNDQGAAGAAGSFQIGGNDTGTLRFTLVGRKSGGKASASVRVSPASGPVDLPPRKPYTLPPSLR